MARQLLLTLCICATSLSVSYGALSDWYEMNGTEWYLSVYANEMFTWHDARAFCMNLGADLASVHSQEEMDQLMEWSQTRSFRDFHWMGFNNLNREGYSWSDGSDVDYTNWKDNYPEKENYGHFCTCSKANTAGEWYNAHCAFEYGVMCRRPLRGTSPPPITDPATLPPSQLGYCPSGFVDAGKKCFKVTPMLEENGVTFEEALGRCRLEAGHIPDLASIHSSYENAVIASQMEQFHVAGLWIGLFMMEAKYGKMWFWTDNSELDFTYWEKNTGPEKWGKTCAEMVYRHPPMGHTGMWNNSNSDCKMRKGYVCQTFKDASSVITTPASTTTNICPAHSVPHNKACYRLVTQAMSWEDANRTCESFGANLVSIHKEPENAFLFAMATRLVAASDVWIGLYHNEVDEVYHWTDGWYVMYTRWDADQPKKEEGGGCVVVDKDGRWRDNTCIKLKPFICETTTAPAVTTPAHIPGKCPRDGDWVPWGDYCYSFNKNHRLGWYSAAEQCRRKHVHAHLVSIHNEVDNDFIYSHVKSTNTYSDVWIGLYRGASDGEFKWVDQSAVQYQHWRPGSPGGADDKSHCVQMSTNRYPKMWEEESCTSNQGYICKTLKRPLVTAPPNVTGSCPDSTWTHYGENCYLFEPDMFSSWESAQKECARRGGAGAMTASIVAEHESDFIHGEMQRLSDLPTKRKYWLCGKKDGVDKPYYWADGQDFDAYDGWANDKPGTDPNGNQNCIRVNNEGMWENTGCDNINAHVCKVKKQMDGDTGATTTVGAPIISHTNPGATVAAVILGVFLALLLAVNVSYCFLRSTNAPKTIIGFSNPLAPSTSDSTEFAKWSANERHGSTASESRKVKIGDNSFA